MAYVGHRRAKVNHPRKSMGCLGAQERACPEHSQGHAPRVGLAQVRAISSPSEHAQGPSKPPQGTCQPKPTPSQPKSCPSQTPRAQVNTLMAQVNTPRAEVNLQRTQITYVRTYVRPVWSKLNANETPSLVHVDPVPPFPIASFSLRLRA